MNLAQRIGQEFKTLRDNELTQKVDVEVGKGLSTEDYTTAEQTKLAGIETGAQVNVPETVTSLVLNGDILTFTDENGVATNVDLSAYKDEDYRAISSGVLNNGIVTFTRDDTTTFTVDLSDLIDGYTLPSDVVQDANYVHTDNNFRTIDKTKLDGIESGAQVNDVTSVNGQTGDVVINTNWTGGTVVTDIHIENSSPALYLKDNTDNLETYIEQNSGYLSTFVGNGGVDGVGKFRMFGTSGKRLAEINFHADSVKPYIDNVTDLGTSTRKYKDIYVSGTVDGRDLSVDGTKLDGIEAGAQVNPTSIDNLSGGTITGNLNVNGILTPDGFFMSNSSFPTAVINSQDETDAVLELRTNSDTNTEWTIRNDYSDTNSLDFRFNNVSMFKVYKNGDIRLETPGAGIKMKSQNGTTYTLTVDDAGNLQIN